MTSRDDIRPPLPLMAQPAPEPGRVTVSQRALDALLDEHARHIREMQDLAREATGAREAARDFKLRILAALGRTDPWAVTTVKLADIERAIASLRDRAAGKRAVRAD